MKIRINLTEAKNLLEAKPSAGLTKKEKSSVAKKAKAGKDIGKKGKGFEKVEKAAEKEYGSKEAGKKLAAAAMWKGQAAKNPKLKQAIRPLVIKMLSENADMGETISIEEDTLNEIDPATID
jgi:hypothetical protein